MRALRHVIAAVGLCGLLAGCSGSVAPRPTALDRSICREINPVPPLPATIGRSPAERSTLRIRHFFISVKLLREQLDQTHDPAFIEAGRRLVSKFDKADQQLHARCKALGL